MIARPQLYQLIDFTDIELRSALDYSDIQRAYLQNELAERVQQRLELAFDPTNSHEFTQQEAYLKGQMEFITQLLTPLTSVAQTPAQLT